MAWCSGTPEVKGAVRNLESNSARDHLNNALSTYGYKPIKYVDLKVLVCDNRSVVCEIGSSAPHVTTWEGSIKIGVMVSAGLI